jgi:hypothetical protein
MISGKSSNKQNPSSIETSIKTKALSPSVLTQYIPRNRLNCFEQESIKNYVAGFWQNIKKLDSSFNYASDAQKLLQSNMEIDYLYHLVSNHPDLEQSVKDEITHYIEQFSKLRVTQNNNKYFFNFSELREEARLNKIKIISLIQHKSLSSQCSLETKKSLLDIMKEFNQKKIPILLAHEINLSLPHHQDKLLQRAPNHFKLLKNIFSHFESLNLSKQAHQSIAENTRKMLRITSDIQENSWLEKIQFLKDGSKKVVEFIGNTAAVGSLLSIWCPPVHHACLVTSHGCKASARVFSSAEESATFMAGFTDFMTYIHTEAEQRHHAKSFVDSKKTEAQTLPPEITVLRQPITQQPQLNTQSKPGPSKQELKKTELPASLHPSFIGPQTESLSRLNDLDMHYLSLNVLYGTYSISKSIWNKIKFNEQYRPSSEITEEKVLENIKKAKHLMSSVFKLKIISSYISINTQEFPWIDKEFIQNAVLLSQKTIFDLENDPSVDLEQKHKLIEFHLLELIMKINSPNTDKSNNNEPKAFLLSDEFKRVDKNINYAINIKNTEVAEFELKDNHSGEYLSLLLFKMFPPLLFYKNNELNEEKIKEFRDSMIKTKEILINLNPLSLKYQKSSQTEKIKETIKNSLKNVHDGLEFSRLIDDIFTFAANKADINDPLFHDLIDKMDKTTAAFQMVNNLKILGEIIQGMIIFLEASVHHIDTIYENSSETAKNKHLDPKILKSISEDIKEGTSIADNLDQEIEFIPELGEVAVSAFNQASVVTNLESIKLFFGNVSQDIEEVGHAMDAVTASVEIFVDLKKCVDSFPKNIKKGIDFFNEKMKNSLISSSHQTS